MSMNPGEPPIGDRVLVAGRPPARPDPARLRSLCDLALRLAREDLAAQAATPPAAK